MSVEALDKRVTFGMFVKGIASRVQRILARTLPAEEKLGLILAEMEKDAQEKRRTARELRTQMVALEDPETQELEPLERLRARRKKVIELGAEALAKGEQARVSQLAEEAKALGTTVRSMEATHATLKEAYEMALAGYKTALAAYEHVKTNGQTMLLAIKAHQDALELRENARRQEGARKADTSFLADMERELERARGELRSDKELDQEIDASRPETGPVAEREPDGAVLAEFRKAAAANV